MRLQLQLQRIFLVLLGLFLLTTCATQQNQVMRYDLPGVSLNRVWPGPPATPRYRFIGQLTGEKNFATSEQSKPGKGKRFLRWLVGLGQSSTEPRVLIRPQSGMVDASTGRIYVSDQGRQAVFVFDEQVGALMIWEQADRNSSFLSPVGIVKGRSGEILVADAELGRVVRLSNQGEALGSFGEAVLQRPTGMARDPGSQKIYVADSAAHNIKVFDVNGSLLDTLGGPGTGPGAFNAPTHLVFADGKLLVSDTLNTRVQAVSASGQPINQIGRRGLYVGNLTRPKGVATDSAGNVYVVESYYDHLLIFNQDGEFLLPIGGNGAAVGQFYLPAGAWSDERDRIFVADMFNGRVMIFQYLGS